MRKPAIHAARFVPQHIGVMLATADDTRVTCRRCLYWARRYIPLGKLREHQAWQRDHYREYLLRNGLIRTVRYKLGEFKGYYGDTDV